MKNDLELNSLVKKINSLENIIHSDVGNRGINGMWIKGELFRAAELLNSSDNILIVTGFYLPKTSAPETDGPPGALSIANALLSLGKKVAILTDKYCLNIIKKSIADSSVNVPLICYSQGIDLESLVKEAGMSNIEKLTILSIERPGRAKDGRFYSMKGYDITAYNEPLDIFFTDFSDNKNIITDTIAIGDGGNEIGMGNIYDYVTSKVPVGEKIASVIKADCLITAGVSNWGGFALAHALKILNTDKDVDVMGFLLHEKIINTMVENGAVDGVTLKSECSVDGINIDLHKKILLMMESITCE